MTEPNVFSDISEVAKFYGKSVRTIYRWQRQGMPAMPDGRYAQADIDAWRRVKKGLDPAPTGTVEGAGDGSVQGQGQLEAGDGKDWWDKENKRWQARSRELDYRKRIGELIEKKKVEDEFVARVHAVKQALVSLERALPPDLVACRSEREMSAVIHKAVYAILENFSRPLPPHLQQDNDLDGGNSGELE